MNRNEKILFFVTILIILAGVFYIGWRDYRLTEACARKYGEGSTYAGNHTQCYVKKPL